MDFDTLDKQMRKFEQSLDRTMLEGIYVVARLDGHGFTRLTKKEWNLEKPFDVRFRDAMIETTKHLMDCGFRMIYGYTQSDEISMLFHQKADTFGRKERKLVWSPSQVLILLLTGMQLPSKTIAPREDLNKSFTGKIHNTS